MSVTIFDRFRRPFGEQLEFFEPSLTEQHHKDDCDVNQILKRFMKTGVLDSRNTKSPLYGDFSGTPQDYASAVQLLDDAKSRFMELPSDVRGRFGNNPLELLRFLDDPANRDEAVKLGLVSASEKGQVASEPLKNGNNPEGVTAEGGKEA